MRIWPDAAIVMRWGGGCRLVITALALLVAILSPACGGEEAPSGNGVGVATEVTVSPSVSTTTVDAPAAPSPTGVPKPGRKSDFEIQVPRGWNERDPDGPGMVTRFANSRAAFHEGAPYRANITVLVDSAPGIPLGDYAQSAKALLEDETSDLALISVRSAKEDSRDTRVHEFTFVREGFPLRSRQLFLANGDEVWVVTATALDVEWGEERTTYEDALASFRLLAP